MAAVARAQAAAAMGLGTSPAAETSEGDTGHGGGAPAPAAALACRYADLGCETVLASAAKEQGHCYRCKFRPAASFKVRAADAPRGPSTDARLTVQPTN